MGHDVSDYFKRSSFFHPALINIISAPTQYQACNSLLFLYRHVDLEIGAYKPAPAQPAAVRQDMNANPVLKARMAGYFVVQSDFIRRFVADFGLKKGIKFHFLEGLHQKVLVGGLVRLGRHIQP